MSYLFIILLFLLLVPVVFKEYNRDKGKFGSAKISTLIISLFLMYLFASTIKGELTWAILESHNFLEDVFIKVGVLTPVISGLSWFLHVTISFVLLVLIILVLLRREKYRKFFLYVLPLYWILNSMNFYKFIIAKNDEVSNFEYLIPLILLMNGIYVALIYVFYSMNFIKRFYQSNLNSH